MKILVAVDPSQHAREAIRFVRSVAWPKNSEIFLVHVVELKNASPLSPSGGPSNWDRVISQVRGKMAIEAKLFLDRIKKEFFQRSPYVIKSIVVEGLPGAEILGAAKNHQMDLVVLGTRGLSNVKRFLLGSTSDWVMREASCSVLLIRGKLSQAAMGKTAAKILLAADGSPIALNLVRMLRVLTFKTTPRVTVTYVMGKPAYLEGWYWGKGKSEFMELAGQLQKKAQQDGATHLQEICQSVKDLNINVDSLLAKGDPADEILKIAERLKTKLIMVGAKGFSGSQPIPLGGVPRKVARYAPCSVLVVRPGSSDKKLER